MEIVTLIFVVVLAGLVGVFLFKKQGEQPAENDQSSLLMQQQIESLRSEVSQSLKTATDTMFQSMRATSENLNQQITLVTQSIQKTTEQVNQQLSAQTSTIGTRLDTAAKVIGDLQKSQGQLLQATEEMKQLGESVAQLEGLLKAPKLRGGLGESMLGRSAKAGYPCIVVRYPIPFSQRQYRRCDRANCERHYSHRFKISAGKFQEDGRGPK